MDSHPNPMHMLLAHQYLSGPYPSTCAGGAETADDDEALPTSPPPQQPKRRPRPPFSAPASAAARSGEYVPFVYSSVNRFTHQLPETLGAHYPAAPYYSGRNEFDTQLLREAAASRRRGGRSIGRAQTAGTRGRTVSAASGARSEARPGQDTATANTSSSSSSRSLPQLRKQSPRSPASALRYASRHCTFADTHTTELQSPHLSLQSTMVRSTRKSRPATAEGTTLAPATIPDPCMRCSVRWAACVVRDELAADMLDQLRRSLPTAVQL
ncbi:hypothetical protein NESM_000328200 [Novymonas esmeraldas]|uniref:Uncharacterized protein n=1 Tax=Novymonas esmeraldas TaxID=1808958 RepID=A0AAW0EKG8_9TRYP